MMNDWEWEETPELYWDRGIECFDCGRLDAYAALMNYGNEFGEWLEETDCRWQRVYRRQLPLTLIGAIALAGELGLPADGIANMTRREAVAWLEGRMRPIGPPLNDTQIAIVTALVTLSADNASYFTWKQVAKAAGYAEQSCLNESRYLRESGWVEKNPVGNGYRIGTEYQLVGS